MSRRTELAGKKVLVTGASGFLGSRTVAALAGHGCAVQALIRQTSRADHLHLPGVTLCRGDVADPSSLQPAFAGMDWVVHAAADTRGDQEASESSTFRGTRNILALAEQFEVGKLVYISSCSVYGTADCRPGEIITEESPLERFPERRGAYSHAKFLAEQAVRETMELKTVPIVCLRPGTIYGPGGSVYTPMMGFSLGRRVFGVIGDGGFVLPLVYVDNLVEAILAALADPAAGSRIYNVVDPEKVTKREYMERMVKKLYPDSRTVYLPLNLLKFMVLLQENACRATGRRPFLTLYRLNSSQNPVTYEAGRIARELGWRPPVSTTAAFTRLVQGTAERN